MFHGVEQLLRGRVQRLPAGHHAVYAEVAEEFGNAVTARNGDDGTGHFGKCSVSLKVRLTAVRDTATRCPGSWWCAELGFALLVFFGNFLEQIGNTNLVRSTAERNRGFDCRADVVGVNVAVVQPFATHHHDGVADLAPLLFERIRLGVVDFQEEHHFVTQLAHVHPTVGFTPLHHGDELFGVGAGDVLGFR